MLIDEFVTVTAGGMAGSGAAAVPRRGATARAIRCVRRMKPLEAGIVGDVSVTVWGAHERPGEE